MKRLICLAVVFVSGAAWPDDVPHEHSGFFFRGEATPLAYATASSDSYTLSGPLLKFDISMGGTIAHHVLLGGEAWLGTVYAGSLCAAGVCEAVAAGEYGFGFRAGAYVGPDVFLSGTLGLTTLVSSLGGSTPVAPTFKFTIGKDWWVSDRWLLGGAAYLDLIPAFDPYINSGLFVATFGLSFAFTKN